MEETQLFELEKIVQYCLNNQIPIAPSNNRLFPAWNGSYLELPYFHPKVFDTWMKRAIHEIAHWMIAAPERRIFKDFGLDNDSSHEECLVLSFANKLEIQLEVKRCLGVY